MTNLGRNLVILILVGIVAMPGRSEARGFGATRRTDEEEGGSVSEDSGGLATADDLEQAIRSRRAGFRSSKKSLSTLLEEGGMTLEEWEREKAAQAQMRITKVEIPEDLLLEYDWSLPFHQAIRRDGIWVCKDMILVLTRGNSLYAIDRLLGRVLWEVVLRSKPSYPPEVTQTAVYVVVDNYIIAIDKVQGQIIWRKQPDFPISASPLVIEPNIFVPAWDGKFYSLEIKRREKVYLRGTTEDTTFRSYEYNLYYRWHHTTQGHIVASATDREGALYFGSEDGYLYSISRDGELRFQFQTQGKIEATPDCSGATCFVGATDFNLYGVDRLTGDEKWHFSAGGDLRKSASVDGNQLVYVPVRNQGYYALNAVTGREMWHIKDGIGIAGLSPDRVYMYLDDNRLAAIDKNRGRVTWISLMRGFAFCVDSPNRWQDPKDPMRVYLVSNNNVLVSLKEQERLFKGEKAEK
ncbi:MAG: PQQ-binding-like beta-propeller repeat protein [Planctomycetes bacterium]|nr:PQQ-binding-like beta-propeller repeat protein [Planctomycetota bacterium]